MREPRYDRNRSRVEDVRDHLFACDAAFTPPLGARVSIRDYAAKLVARAERFEAWAGSDLIGLVAIYCNAADRREAFVTNVSVVPARTRRGIGRRLLLEAIAHVRLLAFERLALSVCCSEGAPERAPPEWTAVRRESARQSETLETRSGTTRPDAALNLYRGLGFELEVSDGKTRRLSLRLCEDTAS